MTLSSSLSNISINACQDDGSKEKIAGEGYSGTILLDRRNSRLKSVDFGGDNIVGYADRLKSIAVKNDLGKIIFYAKEDLKDTLIILGFNYEGKIPSFFVGDDCHFLSYFIDDKRKASSYWEQEEKMLGDIIKTREKTEGTKPSLKLVTRTAQKEDAEMLAKLYQEVFTTYPSPLLKGSYIKSVINDTVLFMAVFDGPQIVSAASAEIDKQNKNAEMTDCATLPAYRGKGLLTVLIKELEKEMWYQDMRVLYSLARAGSYGMNVVLHKLEYNYNGRLINNCHINGRYEDMNIWTKLNNLLYKT